MPDHSRTTGPDDEEFVTRVARAIHVGLGESWAYSNYGGDEWNSMRAELMSAAREAIAVVRQWDAGK